MASGWPYISMQYLSWSQKKVENDNDREIENLYQSGYLFTRLAKGIMQKTRSVRIDLKKFKLSSENRRIIKKNTSLHLQEVELPLQKYDWSIGKLAKDFYDTKFGKGIMSAQKVKEMLTEESKSNFNTLYTYSSNDNSETIAYVICYKGRNFLHYSYPFYDLRENNKDLGLGMMLKAILDSQEKNCEYIYLGSLQRANDIYKLQFEGLQWFDGHAWREDLEEVKKILSSAKMN